MPFAAPPTYFSKATTGYKATFNTGDTSSPVNFTALLEMKSFKANLISVPEVDVTHLLSPLSTHEIQPGLIKPGTLDISGNLIGDATQLNITTLAQAQTVFPFTAIASVQQGAATQTIAGKGYIADWSVGPYENDKPLEYALKVQMVGAYTQTVV